MSKRAAEMLADDLEAMGPIRVSEGEAAQKEILFHGAPPGGCAGEESCWGRVVAGKSSSKSWAMECAMMSAPVPGPR